jgi:hypothetical protein
MLSVIASVLSGTMYLIFGKETIEEQGLKKGMTLRIQISGISRKNEYFEKNITYRKDLQFYTNTSLKLTIIKKFADALALQDGDIVNIEILTKE